MHKRLRKWMDISGIKGSEIADEIGVNRSTITHILSGRNKPSIDFVNKLLNSYPNLNANWFITGLGNMYHSNLKHDNLDVKKLSKIIVFYEDGSFEELNR